MYIIEPHAGAITIYKIFDYVTGYPRLMKICVLHFFITTAVIVSIIIVFNNDNYYYFKNNAICKIGSSDYPWKLMIMVHDAVLNIFVIIINNVNNCYYYCICCC